MDQLINGKKPQDCKIVVAMSGGVDSSVAAALLLEAGYGVIGVTLQLYDHGASSKKKSTCCAGQDIYDARNVATRLGIPHYVLDYETRFEDSVMQDFADSYIAGETPIPCVRCNQTVKFRDLLTTARELGADALATGHYIRRVKGSHGAELYQGYDKDRDQSYFLFATTQEQLEYLRFPLGALPKAETRAHAKRFNLSVAAKPDSQDICFVPNGSYSSIVEKLRPGAAEPGEIVDCNGKVLGRHKGIIGYTIGQRRGLNLGGRSANSEPLYVVRLEPEKRHVVVGSREALAISKISLNKVNLLVEASEMQAFEKVMVKFRSAMMPVNASVKLLSSDRAEVHFAEPQFSISAGQACVFYRNERLLGGGWITRH